MDVDFSNYLTVLEKVREIQEPAAGSPAVPGFMFDASPSQVHELRHHCHHITGVRADDYGGHTEVRDLFKQKLKRLAKVGGKDILVPEPPALGGFGFRFGGELYNLDTLKFYEALIAMRRGAILGDFMNAAEHQTVVEIDAGWGGFAYQFKTLCPNVTYVIVDRPARFLFSAVYLMNRFPNAVVRFIEKSSDTVLDAGWQDVDFLFVPDSSFEALRFERLDLMINLVSFESMPIRRVETYIRWAYERDCPLVYSFNRDRDPANDDLASLTETIRSRYWPHDIPVMPVDFHEMLDGVVRGKSLRARLQRQRQRQGRGEYRHIIGWRRLLR